MDAARPGACNITRGPRNCTFRAGTLKRSRLKHGKSCAIFLRDFFWLTICGLLLELFRGSAYLVSQLFYILLYLPLLAVKISKMFIFSSFHVKDSDGK